MHNCVIVCGSQGTTCGILFSPSIMRVLGIKLRFSGLPVGLYPSHCPKENILAEKLKNKLLT